MRRVNGGAGARVRRLVPALAWGPRYDRAWLRTDVLAGLTVAALVVPKALGYAGIANVPIENGLYAAAAGTILYALFGTSRQVSTGPSSALAAVAGSVVITVGVAEEAQATALVAGIALVAGVMFLLMAVFRLGWISDFLSRAVTTGFLFGAAIDVTIGELPKLTGTDGDGDNAWRELGSWLRGLDAFHGTTLLVGGLALVGLFGLRWLAPRLPNTLIVVAVAILASAVLDLGDHGVALVGDVPRGLPTPAVPDLTLVFDNVLTVLVASAGIVLVGFSQTAGDARHFATKHGYRVDIGQETVAQGVANVGAGLIQGMPVSTSLSASSLNDNAGARSPVASLSTGGAVVLTLLALAPLFASLPKPVLAAVIIEAVVMGMMDVAEMRRLRRVKPGDFWIAVAAIVGVLTFGVLAGIVIGALLSVGWLVHVTTRPQMPVLGRMPGSHVFRELEAHPEDEVYAGIIALRLESGLFFATADALGDRLRGLVLASPAPVTAVVLDCADIPFVDSQGSASLGEMVELARNNGIRVRLARVKPAVLGVLERDGVLDVLGEDHVHDDVHQAVETQRHIDRTPPGAGVTSAT
ncbi:MAG TPA: sulfate permease [Ornithinibacter sp.]|nr:sulfate permease [Ornithinibacter sp.]